MNTNWNRIDKDTYITSGEIYNGIIKRKNRKWQCYVFYSFGVYVYTDTCLFKKHAQKIVDMRLENISWKPYYWMGYRICDHWYKFKKNDYSCWKNNWAYATKEDAKKRPEYISYSTSFIPENSIIKMGFEFDIINRN